MSTPYKDGALAHFDKGWQVFPCTPRGKEPLVRGRSGGYASEPVSREVVERESVRFDKANIGIRIPDDMIALDLDNRPEADGAAAFAELDLPDTVGIGHGSDALPPRHRHHLYRVPDEVSEEDVARLRDSRGGIDLLRWMHRLTVGAGSLHKSGEVYRWVRKDGQWAAPGAIPTPAQCTALTLEEWERIVEFFGERASSTIYGLADTDIEEWLQSVGQGQPSDAMKSAVLPWKERTADAQRHSAAGQAAYRVAQEAEDGEPGAQKAFAWLRAQFVEAVGDRSDEGDAHAEFDRLMVSAIQKAVAKTEAGDREGPVTLDVVIERPKGEKPKRSTWRQRRDNAYNCSVNSEPVEFAREYIERHFMSRGVTGSDNASTDVEVPGGLASTGVETLKFVNNAFWRWSDKKHHWVRIEDDRVRSWIMADLRGAWEVSADDSGVDVKPVKLKMKNVNEIFAASRGLLFDDPETAVGGVPFEDGWLDARTGAVEPLGPHRYHTWCVPAKYEASDCPNWIRFLESVGWGEGTEEHRLLRQWFGYLLSGENQKQKMLLLHGPTRSGKGTILAIAYHLMGDGATGLRLTSLGGEFGLQPLLGKSLAVVGDARFTARIDKSVVEALLSISGRDPQSVNVKGKPQVSTRLPTRVMMATNERPVFTDSSNALPERFLILKMTKSFLGQEDEGLEERLRGELAGIARWALDGYKDLTAHGFKQTEVGREMVDDFIKDSAPVRYFVEDECELAAPDWMNPRGPNNRPVRDFKVRNDDLYQAYRLWCERGGHHPLNNVHFARELLTAFEGQILDGKSGGARVKYGVQLRKGR